jgi:hypothetical protein
MFNDALAPAEWSFSTYTRPFLSAATGAGAADGTARVHAVEEVLWALMAGPAYYDGVNFHFEDDANNAYFNWDSAGTALTIDWARSNKSTLGTCSIIFQVGDGTVNYKYYEITGSVVNEATINFDIDGIAMIEWSGFGAIIQETTQPTPTIYEAITSTSNFIRNRLTQMTLVPNVGGYTSAQYSQLEAAGYDITLTGGSLTVSNNITFITPEELGVVNKPIGHVTGNRSFGGSFTAYLVDDDGDTNETGDLWQDLAALTDVVTHNFDATFFIGGSSGDPRVSVNFPQAHLEVPTHEVGDLISMTCNITGLPSTIDNTDEATVGYYSTITP